MDRNAIADLVGALSPGDARAALADILAGDSTPAGTLAGLQERAADLGEPEEDDSYPPACTDRMGHRWVCSDENEELSYCANCGADGNA